MRERGDGLSERGGGVRERGIEGENEEKVRECGEGVREWERDGV